MKQEHFYLFHLEQGIQAGFLSKETSVFHVILYLTNIL